MNLAHLLTATSLAALDAEVDRNVKQLMDLAEEHFSFGAAASRTHWRQRVSRFYYAAYAVSRAARLHCDGTYTSEVKDHEKVGDLPDGFPQRERYKNDLRVLREDRNLCDYDHTAAEGELGFSQQQAETLVQDFITDGKTYLTSRGLTT